MEERTYGRKTVRRKTYTEKILRLLVITLILGILIGFVCGKFIFKTELSYGAVKENVFLADEPFEYTSKMEKNFVPLDVDMDENVQKFIYYMSEESGIEFSFVMGLIKQESNFKEYAIGNHEDFGLMQINEVNHEMLSNRLGITDFLDPYQNVKGGMYILRNLFEKYEEPSKVLMAYNMGETGARTLWNQGIYETDYSIKVMRNAAEFAEELEGEL